MAVEIIERIKSEKIESAVLHGFITASTLNGISVDQSIFNYQNHYSSKLTFETIKARFYNMQKLINGGTKGK